MLCHRWAFRHICRECLQFLEPTVTKRKLLGNIPVYSFYRYDEIEPLLLTKHTDIGYYLYRILARQAFSMFTDSFAYDGRLAVCGIDDRPQQGYAHTALLVKALNHSSMKQRYGRLQIEDHVSYSGKSMEFRLANPRKYKIASFPEEEVVLVDDIITTGLTLSSAVQALQRRGKQVPFCLALANAERKKR
jgi:competence protein ComFC